MIYLIYADISVLRALELFIESAGMEYRSDCSQCIPDRTCRGIAT